MTMRSQRRPGAPFALPRVSSAERDALALGNVRADETLVVFNTTTGQVEAWTGVAWAAVGGRQTLTEATTFYVDADSGDDGGEGTISSPFLTLAAAVAHVTRNVDTAGFLPTVQMQNATNRYAGAALDASPMGRNNYVLQGESVGGVFVSSSIIVANGAQVRMRDFTFEQSANDQVGIWTSGHSLVQFEGDMGFTEDGGGRTGLNCLLANTGGTFVFGGPGGTITVDDVSPNVLFWGRRNSHIQWDVAYTIAQTGTVAYGTAALLLQSLSSARYDASITVTGTGTGKRWDVQALSHLMYGSTAYIPGTVAGTVVNGGRADAS